MESNEERLEQIKNEFKPYDFWKYEDELNWLIQQAERAQELEKALEFYAEFHNYNYGGSIILKDAGELARKALEESE